METVVAEKMEAAVSLGINNSRMKDFYDLHWLQSRLNFDGNDLTSAINNTFARRGTIIPDEVDPMPFTAEFSSDAQKREQWSAFLRKGKLPHVELSVVLNDIAKFVLPVLQKQVFNHLWTPEEHWQAGDPKGLEL